MLEPLGSALQPVEGGGRLLATTRGPDELALDAVPLHEQAFELLRGAVAGERGRLAAFAGLCPDILNTSQLELCDPCTNRADLDSQPLRPLSGSGLQRERPEPLLDLVLEVARALDVDRHTRELQLRPVPAPLEAPQPGGLFDKEPALLGLRAEDLLDAALADDRAHLAAEADVREQLHEIRPADRGAVDEVLPLPSAVQAPHERDLRERQLLERAVLVVEQQLDLAVLRRRTVLPACEQNVVRLLGPQLARRQAPRGPEQRIRDVRLPRAVRPDDHGHAALQPNLHGLGERLEAAQLDRS